MLSKEAAVAELWRRGELTWKLHSAQLKIYEKLNEHDGKLFVANASRRFGKSFLMVLYAIQRALKVPGTKIRYGAAFQTDLEEFIIPAFNLILADCPEEIRPIYKSQRSKYLFNNGSEIKLFGVDKNPDSARGNAISVIILDESGYIDRLEYLLTSVVFPATMYQDNVKIVLISTPPISPDHAFKDYCEKAKLENSYCEFTIYDNPMATLDVVEECKRECGGENTTVFKREYLCQFIVDTERAIIPEWREEFECEVEQDEFYQFYHKYVSLDTGFRDLTVALFGYFDFRKAALIVLDEFVINGPELTIKALADGISEKEADLWDSKKPHRRVADNNDLIVLNDLGLNFGIHFIPTGKDSLDAMVNEVREMVSNGKVLVHPRCRQLIGCLRNGIWDKQRKKFDRSKVFGHYDALSSLVYMVRNIDRHSNPIPSLYGYDPANTHINPNFNKQSHELGRLFGGKKYIS